MVCCVIEPGNDQAQLLELDMIDADVIKKQLGGDFSILQVPGLKEKGIDVFALKGVPKGTKPSLVVVNGSVTPSVITDAILGKIILLGVDENKNTTPLSDEQMVYLTTCNEFMDVGTLDGKIVENVLSFTTK